MTEVRREPMSETEIAHIESKNQMDIVNADEDIFRLIASHRALAARVQELERERDELKEKAYRYAHWTPEHTIEEWLADRQRIVEAKQVEADAALRQQLAEAQGTVEKQSAEHMKVIGFLDAKLIAAQQQVERLEAEKHTFKCAAEASLEKRLQAEQQVARLRTKLKELGYEDETLY